MENSIAFLFVALLLLAIVQVITGFNSNLFKSKSIGLSRTTLSMSDDFPLNDRTRERLDTLVKGNKVLLFMKGNKLFPQWLVVLTLLVIQLLSKRDYKSIHSYFMTTKPYYVLHYYICCYQLNPSRHIELILNAINT
jgi:type IV secretory pathway VirB3-like protein